MHPTITFGHSMDSVDMVSDFPDSSRERDLPDSIIARRRSIDRSLTAIKAYCQLSIVNALRS